MIAFVGLVKRRVSFACLKVEVAAVYYNSAQSRGVSVEVLGRGVYNNVCAKLLGAAERGSGKRVVNGKQNAVFFTNLCNFIKVDYGYGGVCNRFDKHHFGFAVDEFFYFLRRRIGVEEPALYAELGQGGAEQVICAAVYFRRA